MTWIATLSGRALDLLDPDPAAIDFGDVAHGLGRLPRFSGQTAGCPYSVAQHCVLGSDAIIGETGSPALGALFLLHDAHEFATNDLTTPMQQAIGGLSLGARTAIKTIQRRLDEAIHRAAGCPLPLPAETAALKAMDLRLCRAERDALMGPQPRAWAPAVETAAAIPGLPAIAPWPADLAEGIYRNRLDHYFPGLLRRAA